MYELNICHLYPDLLNLYGDRGNIIALKRRSEWRGIKITVSNITLGDNFIPENYDIIFLGGGQDYEQTIIQDDLLKKKGGEIKNAIMNDKIFLCICGGYQLLGKYYKTWDGKEIEFLGILDLWTIGGQKRMIGNIAFECDFLKSESCDGKVIGFENHSGRTYLGVDVKPLGRVLRGNGNNGEDDCEGALYKNVHCSYSHGSLLPKNPAFTDHLLTLALKQKYKDFVSLQPLDDVIESRAHDSMIKRIL
ncbi:type 1 glutamine amidotransferase [Pseudobacteroides cellulosolvens]|uniref:Lipid II isoglutaminyl synthase (glutamine-hydrolyzing) subunit GatD n=1 Tax=Pseudobacteroides cellulosolvens ATCC 35603 = DSM 2933 TaxID=398512 RepID=A0A0L6JGN4_9FIRM|nr:type 1 glutamine amidotransferase [Pseudobacteroides cellulosolvens]KNY25026.1 CobB/CobQ domain protein glutamine amidotransferase [Pseudobacteroides cellulosolvens ATCC 35603 = DSM 2933]